ncbi:hypothetical protein HC776_00090 [bacterium]|nr:hypothetical protein [bacterium]
MSSIPARQPYAEAIIGQVIKITDRFVLVADPLSAPAEAEILYSDGFFLRYGVEYLGKPQYSIVPGLIALDYGEMLVGEEAWHFLFRRSNLYPRADVLGYRNDGVDDMIPIKFLDLMQPIHALLYQDGTVTTPLCRLSAVIALADRLPPWLLQYRYLPCYPSLSDYQAQTHDDSQR